ncbi:maleylpyruvate isomerase family mycothiol-dependent enzyme [Streptomyces sp. NPDC054962]
MRSTGVSSNTAPTARTWMERCTALFLQALADLDNDDMDADTALPGWTRRHIVAHVASNAEALQRLAMWARTGEPTPMYASREQRDTDIERGARLAVADLRHWAVTSAQRLNTDLDSLPPHAWRAEVVTIQGRTVPCTELPWLRSRETAVHAVDLAAGVEFADLPRDFCLTLIDDVVRHRSAVASGPAVRLHATDTERMWTVGGSDTGTEVRATVADLARWLVGRGNKGVRVDHGDRLPRLPRWL